MHIAAIKKNFIKKSFSKNDKNLLFRAFIRIHLVDDEGFQIWENLMTGFDDVILVLGYYDERLPETMVVHNIDYELYC